MHKYHDHLFWNNKDKSAYGPVNNQNPSEHEHGCENVLVIFGKEVWQVNIKIIICVS
jgi:hypothetical protein